MLIPFLALAFAAQGMYRAFKGTSSKPKPVYVKTWPDEIEGYPASDFVRNL